MDSVLADNRRENPEESPNKIDQDPTGLHVGLRRIPDKFPPVALLILVVEVC
jgi:POT family proton-dependent oligopeptide transporter